ncbi:hypothetical protein QHH_54 [Halomonas phage QHHSV-1]|nr:hypothetical protein QHH_54 [Halomonas phage QHHSV-1]
MTPTELENFILIALRNAGGSWGSDGMTVGALHKALATATGEGPSWRQVASYLVRLERMGLAYIAGDETIGEDCHPIYALTPAGVQAAHSARIQKHNAAVAGTAKESTDADH